MNGSVDTWSVQSTICASIVRSEDETDLTEQNNDVIEAPSSLLASIYNPGDCTSTTCVDEDM